MTTKLDSMARLIDAFGVLHSEQQQSRLDTMRRVVIAFHDRRRQRKDEGQAGFNIFSLVGLDTDEVRHSTILAWLLDAEAGHGQGDTFLRAFLDACRPSVSLPIPDEYQVQTEFSGVLSRIDILVHQVGEFLLYIENKTVSPDTPGQHDREFNDMRRVGSMLDVPEDAQFAIYLTPGGREASGDHAQNWHSISYRDMCQAFEDLLPRIRQDKVRYVLADWLDTILTFTGTWRQSMTGFSDESLLIAENWNAVLDIVRARERIDEELREILHSVQPYLEELEWWDEDWQFRISKHGIYIRNTNWLNAAGYGVLYMGVVEFDATHVFGLKTPPMFYVAIQKDCQDLQHTLLERIRADGYAVNEGKWYFIRRDVQKCATERQAIQEYPQAVQRQIIDLFTEYAKLMMQFDETIRQYVQELETTT